MTIIFPNSGRTILGQRPAGSRDDTDTVFSDFSGIDTNFISGMFGATPFGATSPNPARSNEKAPVNSTASAPELDSLVLYDGIPTDLFIGHEDYVTSGGKWGPSGAFGTSGGTVTWSIAGAGWGNASIDPTWFSGTTVSSRVSSTSTTRPS